MKNWPFQIGFLIVGVIIAVAYWQFYRPGQQASLQVVAAPPISKPQAEPATQHPVTTAPEELKAAEAQPLPELRQSDTLMAELMAKLFADQKLDRFFVFEHFIERFVVMVDNLPRPQLPVTHRPLKKTSGTFLTNGKRDRLTIDPANYRRYTPCLLYTSPSPRDRS